MTLTADTISATTGPINDAGALLNDVDIAAVGELAARVIDDPTVAATTWQARVSWDRAFQSSARIRQFAPIRSDEPASLGGGDTAPNPVEQLLAALGNCLAVGYAANATAAGIELEHLSIDLEGELNLQAFLGLDSQGNAGFESIRVAVDLKADAAPDELAALHQRVVGTSPVGHTLQRAVPVAIELR